MIRYNNECNWFFEDSSMKEMKEYLENVPANIIPHNDYRCFLHIGFDTNPGKINSNMDGIDVKDGHIIVGVTPGRYNYNKKTSNIIKKELEKLDVKTYKEYYKYSGEIKHQYDIVFASPNFNTKITNPDMVLKIIKIFVETLLK